MDYAIVLTTCPNDSEARNLASAIVDKKLASCVQLSKIESFYIWEENACIDPEIRLTIKTKTALYEQLEEFIQNRHSYEVPQIIMIPVTNGSEDYLRWIDENTL